MRLVTIQVRRDIRAGERLQLDLDSFGETSGPDRPPQFYDVRDFENPQQLTECRVCKVFGCEDRSHR